MKKEELLYILTGTETPKFLTERELKMVDQFLVLIGDMKIDQEIQLTEMFKLMVVRGCFRGTESKQGRNYETAKQALKEKFGIDYETKVDELPL
jgi:hypothetical protein